MATLNIKHLQSGGIITNYFCTSSCRHCLYNCGPHWPKDYLEPELANVLFRRVRELGCRSVHIGGGEPFLRAQKLADILGQARRAGVHIDYVETNSAWYQDLNSAKSLLMQLRSQGLQTLLVSISPFHNEFIPFSRIKGVIEACRQTNINVFPWIADFYSDLEALASDRTHALEAYEKCFGKDYLKSILDRYWIHMGGRALNTFRSVLPIKTAEQIMDVTRGGCAGDLTDTSHFHLDLYANYIPGLCSGLAIAQEDLGKGLGEQKYPLITTLARQGIKGLYDLAHNDYGFKPKRSGYINKCDLCTDIRTFIIHHAPATFKDLQPPTFYGKHASSGKATSSGSM